MFRVTFAPTALRSWESLPRSAQRKFNQAFTAMTRNPRQASVDLDVHQLRGYRNLWTLRIPPFRGIYVIEGTEVVLIVFGHRELVYSRLHGLLPPEGRSVSTSGLARRR
ncbi:MAG: type II toxin-antitoxin system RelE/ParE family toxin [Thermoplasmata archaeon]